MIADDTNLGYLSTTSRRRTSSSVARSAHCQDLASWAVMGFYMAQVTPTIQFVGSPPTLDSVSSQLSRTVTSHSHVDTA